MNSKMKIPIVYGLCLISGVSRAMESRQEEEPVLGSYKPVYFLSIINKSPRTFWLRSGRIDIEGFILPPPEKAENKFLMEIKPRQQTPFIEFDIPLFISEPDSKDKIWWGDITGQALYLATRFWPDTGLPRNPKLFKIPKLAEKLYPPDWELHHPSYQALIGHRAVKIEITLAEDFSVETPIIESVKFFDEEGEELKSPTEQ
jgi:hypothetical protein